MIINQVVKGGGTTPTGTKQITTNGIHDVAAYANADVQVPTTAPTYYRQFKKDSSGKLVSDDTVGSVMAFSGVKNFDNYLFYKAYTNDTSISGTIDLSDLQDITGSYCCYNMLGGCTGITGVTFNSLSSLGGEYCFGYMFENCTGLTSISLGGLKVISLQYAARGIFSGCSNLTSIDISCLTTIANATQALMYAFQNCTRLTDVKLSSLKRITSSECLRGAFTSCTSLTELKLPALTTSGLSSYTNQFSFMLFGISGITLHFPSNIQAKVETLSGYSTTTPFGATSGTVLFDLPATVTLTGANSINYERNPKYDTATALAWRVQDTGTTYAPTIDWTPFYTNGTTDPQVNDTIYSDSACTTAVTTISSIA